MKSILTACLFAAASLQAQTLEWAKSFGAGLDDWGQGIIVDASGNIYITGYFRGTVDFDPGAGIANLTTAGNRDVFVQKLDASGNFVWAKSFGGSYSDEGKSIAIDDSGNVYTTGYFQVTADFDPGAGTANLTSAGAEDIFVQKLDSSGSFIWAKSFGGNSYDYGYSILVDASGHVYTTGYFRNTVDFDPGAGIVNLTSAGDGDVFVHKLDASGNLLWVKSFGASGDDRGKDIALDTSGNVYTIGNYAWTVDFDPGVAIANLSSAGNADVFIQKLDASGNFLWAESFGGGSSDYGNSITVDASGNVFTTGYFRNTVDFDPGAGTANLASAGFDDVFVQKLDTSGNFLWAKSFGGSTFDYGNSISVDASGNVYTTGYFEGTADFDPGSGTASLTSAGNRDVFIQKLDASGNFLWSTSHGGSSQDEGRCIALDTSGSIYTTGLYSGTADFDPGVGTNTITSAGDRDGFIQKLSQCAPDTGTDVITACNSYTWIDGITYTESNNMATHTLTNIAGCDSVVTLNLTINEVSDITTSTTGITITANNASATYQWLDCNNSNVVITGETSQIFTATVNGNYAVELTENGCVDTSACVSITTVGILENNFGQTINVFPNPTVGTFTIDLGNEYDSAQIIIRDAIGRIVHKSNFTSESSIQVSLDEPAGIYLIEVDSGDKRAKLKLIKE